MKAAPRSKEPAAAGTEDVKRVFAAVEQYGVWIGVGLTLAGFFLYVTGWLGPYLPIENLIRNRGLPTTEFIRQSGLPGGWDWIWLLGHGDMLALLGLVLLSCVALVAYLCVLPSLLRQRDWIYALLVLMQVGVFLLAASGWVAVGH